MEIDVQKICGKSVERHIEAMRRIWNELEEKPVWLSLEKINEYEEKMKEEKLNG